MTTHFPTFGAPTRMGQRRLLPLSRCGAFLYSFLLLASGGRAQQSRFDIWKGDNVVGSILAQRTPLDERRTQYLMTSYSAFDVIWKQEVRSLVSALYEDGVLSHCHTHMKVNGSLRDSSSCAPQADETRCYVHPDERFIHQGKVEWTTARMYFEEPVGQRNIFVESVMKHCAIHNIGPGSYRLVLPDDKVNLYTYRDGRLEEIRVDRSLFDLVFKRST